MRNNSYIKYGQSLGSNNKELIKSTSRTVLERLAEHDNNADVRAEALKRLNPRK